jgi:alkanesulfonate monooxygenase SsuD/methylene tetrahydromethanopterin reductase-like flavin-dependent oxidoreductase (luciferase family)
MVDPFTTLISIGNVTKHLILGMATLVPIRHPLVTSQLIGGMSFVTGAERLSIAIGAGGQKASFDAVEGPWDRRVDMVKEYVEVMKLTWTGEGVSHSGEFFSFENVTIDPRPPADTPIWYGGSTPASVRRTFEYCDGWFPGRCDMRTLDKRLEQMDDLSAERGIERPYVGIVPIITIGKSREDALAPINVEGMLEEARGRRFWTGPFEKAEDLEGVLIAGSPDECIAEVGKFIDRGIDQLVFDFRMRPEEYDQQVAWLARDVLPGVQELAAARA